MHLNKKYLKFFILFFYLNKLIQFSEIVLKILKTEIFKQRLLDINPNIKLRIFDEFYTQELNAKIFNTKPDFVIDAIDSVESKIALYRWASRCNIPFISSMGAASKIDLTKIKIAKISQTVVCPLAARIRRLIRGQELPDFPVVFSSEMPQPVLGHAKNLGSVITVTGVFGLCLANWVVQEIINKK